MRLEKVFHNLTAEETEQATGWFEHLRVQERGSIRAALEAINPAEFHLDNSKNVETQIAVIAAGSSIDTAVYRDIDLFLLAREPLRIGEKIPARRNPGITFYHELQEILPSGVVAVEYKKTILPPKPSLETISEPDFHALITVSLFYEKQGFDRRRSGHPDDLLEPRPFAGAERIMQYNCERGSKFLVLSRQYPLISPS